MNWQTFKCRCSGIHKIMANSRSNPQISVRQMELLTKYNIRLDDGETLTATQLEEYKDLKARYANRNQVVLSDTCIEYLMEVYAWETQGMVAVRKEMEEIDQMEKGKMVEEESITLLSIVEGVLYEKNDERVQNDFLSGEPDVFIGPDVMQASKITDIKSAFDYPTFLKKINKGLENGWEEQVQGYMDITGASEGEIAHCLVDMPLIMQLDYKKRMFYKGNYVTEESPDFKRKWEALEKSMNFGAIPPQQRVYKVPVTPFTEFQRQAVYDRVKVCREWLNNFDEMYGKLNILVGELENTQ